MLPREVLSGQILFGERRHAIYTVLPFLEPGLMLDVGAAAGAFTYLMLKMNPQSRVYAFEPFPGNHPFFEKRLAGDQRATLIKKAVGEKPATVNFYVSSVVSGSEKGWSEMAGYSSLGHIVSAFNPKSMKSISVECCRIDDVADDHVRFCKIDVQGGELGVLKGAQGLISGKGIDVLFVEFGGELEILEFASANGYAIFDSEYIITPVKSAAGARNWNIFHEVAKSTGSTGQLAWPVAPPRDFGGYCKWLKSEFNRIGSISTDLVFVREDYIPKFLEAAAKAITKGPLF